MLGHCYLLAGLSSIGAGQASVQLRDGEIARLAAEVQRRSSHIDEAAVQRRAETHETIILQLHGQVSGTMQSMPVPVCPSVCADVQPRWLSHTLACLGRPMYVKAEHQLMCNLCWQVDNLKQQVAAQEDAAAAVQELRGAVQRAEDARKQVTGFSCPVYGNMQLLCGL